MSKNGNNKLSIALEKGQMQFAREASAFFISMADDTFDALGIIRQGVNTSRGKTLKLTDLFEQPDTDEWIRLYRRRHDLLVNSMKLLGDFGTEDEVAEMCHFFRSTITAMHLRPKGMLKQSIEFAQQNPKAFEEMQWESQSLAGGLPFTREGLLHKVDEDSSEEQMQNILSDVKLQFMIRIFLPCLSSYQTTPSQLMRKARSGDTKALCNLIKLDELVIYDKKIKKLIAKTLHENPAKFKKEIAPALSKTITPLKKRAFKNAIAGFLHSNFKDFGKLSIFDIRQGFDYCSEERTGRIIDKDLQDDDDAHKKAVERSRKLWNKNYKQL